MTTHRFLSLIFACSVVATPALVAAQNDSTQKAKEYYDRGAALYFEGDYSKAVLEFMRAYDTLPEPVFLYNIALSHWRLGNLDKSISVAEETLRHDGLDEGLDATVNGRLVAIRRLRVATSSTWSAPPAEEIVAEAPTIEAAETAPAPSNAGFSALGWTGVALATAGGGLLTAFAVTEVGLQKTIEDYEAAAAAGDAERYGELREQIDARQPLSLAFLWTGVAATAVGVTLLVIDLTGDSDEVELVFTPSGAGLKGVW